MRPTRSGTKRLLCISSSPRATLLLAGNRILHGGFFQAPAMHVARRRRAGGVNPPLPRLLILSVLQYTGGRAMGTSSGSLDGGRLSRPAPALFVLLPRDLPRHLP